MFGGKYPVRMWLRYETVKNATIKVYISYDDGAWELAAELPKHGSLDTENTPVPIRRCDHFAVKLSAPQNGVIDTANKTAGFTLHAIMFEVVAGEGRSRA